MGVVIAGTLLVGRLASRTCRPRGRRALVWSIAAGSILLGLVFYALDLRDAWARKEAAELAAERIRSQDPQAVIWFAGHWGFQYYAERAAWSRWSPTSPASARAIG